MDEEVERQIRYFCENHPVAAILLAGRHPESVPYLRMAYQTLLDNYDGNVSLLSQVLERKRTTLTDELNRLGVKRQRQDKSAEIGGERLG